MSDPTLKSASVTIRYTSSDGYSMETCLKGGPSNPLSTAEHCLLDTLEELARLTALFGLQEKASERVEGSFKRVAEWRDTR